MTKNSLPFLDISFNVQPERTVFCSWYRKSSDTGSLNYCSCAPLQYNGTIHSLFRKVSNWEAFHEAMTKNDKYWERI